MVGLFAYQKLKWRLAVFTMVICDLPTGETFLIAKQGQFCRCNPSYAQGRPGLGHLTLRAVYACESRAISQIGPCS